METWQIAEREKWTSQDCNLSGPSPLPSWLAHQMGVLGALDLESLRYGGGGVPTVGGG